jgi:YHS domain-containing protein
MRPDKGFPAAIGKEPIPTPQPQEQVPVPEGPLPKTKLPGEGILPPTGPINIKEGSSLLRGGLEEPAEPMKSSPPKKVEGTLPGLPPAGGGLTPESGADKRLPGLRGNLNGGKLLPAGRRNPPPPTSPPDIPKTDGDGALNRQPSGRSSIYRDESAQREPQGSTIQANWTQALEPGFRGGVEAQRLTSTTAQNVRPATHQAPTETSGRGPVSNPVFEEPLQQPTHIAQAASHQASRQVALDGYCPVELGKNERWVKGDARWTEVYQGVAYMFSSPVQRECFLIDPERYVPAFSGRDPVLLMDSSQSAPGRLEHCATYNGRLYMFSSASSLARFHQQPQRYASPVR